ncbi:ROK family transcriptional regulator [Agromyces archimandritae]|uniref:ROK family transcriptional regulator n=1 Tax=Agromyces archimandritae TaxID=2781962 RepID=A0A975IN44_9MICO|nr:ROK family transcriptional regulator [Agromyces archimandritae]QTX04222.1 ROK family transcriptional regulator [Agromyces archimandritae]
MRRGSNLPAVGTYNQTLVLDLIRRSADGLSRSELAERTGLSAQTLSNVARRLVDTGMVVEGAPVVAGKGKPPTPLRLNPQSRFAVGIHLDPAVDTFVLVDLAGTVVAHEEHAPHPGPEHGMPLPDLASRANELLDRAGVRRDRVLGIGVAAPGPIDAERGSLLEPPMLPAWHHVPLRDSLQQATGLPVTVEKDVVAAMVGELWVDASQGLGEAIFFYYGAGVGVGLAVDATPVRGRTGNAGDVAHLVVEPGGPACRCGNRGCLGVAVAPERLIEDAGLGAGTAPAEWRALLGEMTERALAGDARAGAVFDRTAESLARAMVAMNNLLDADVVVIGGPMWSRISRALEPRLARALATSTESTTTRGIELLGTRLHTDVAAVGAACLVLDGAFTARPAGLMIG